ncbi:MAG: hypothetical protein ACFFD2_15035, partial [Promethearchaeota archaeon]
MSKPNIVEEVFKNITDSFSVISKQVTNINKAIENLGLNFSSSMVQVSEQIGNLTKALQTIMKVSDLKNMKETIHKTVETLRKELACDELKMVDGRILPPQKP